MPVPVIALFAEAGGLKTMEFRPNFRYREATCYCNFIIDTTCTSALAQKDKSVSSLRSWKGITY